MLFPVSQFRSTGRRGTTGVLVAAVIWTLTACGGSGGSSGSSDSASDLPPTQNQSSDLHADTVRDRVIAHYRAANLGRDPNKRNLRQGLVNQGWQPFIDIVLSHIDERGLRRVMIHTPFGREEPIQFDGYLEAQQMDVLNKVTGTFVDDWQDNVTAPSLGREIEVIGYIGSPRNDPDSGQILAEKGEEAFFERARSSVKPLLDANMSVALDAASAAEKDTITHRFAERLRQDVKVYTEANGPADHTWWFDYPIIVLEETWQSRKGEGTHSSREQLQGELIRIVRFEDNRWIEGHPPDVWPQAACRIIAEGDTAAVPGRLLNSTQRHISGLVKCANELRN